MALQHSAFRKRQQGFVSVVTEIDIARPAYGDEIRRIVVQLVVVNVVHFQRSAALLLNRAAILAAMAVAVANQTLERTRELWPIRKHRSSTAPRILLWTGIGRHLRARLRRVLPSEKGIALTAHVEGQAQLVCEGEHCSARNRGAASFIPESAVILSTLALPLLNRFWAALTSFVRGGRPRRGLTFIPRLLTFCKARLCAVGIMAMCIARWLQFLVDGGDECSAPTPANDLRRRLNIFKATLPITLRSLSSGEHVTSIPERVGSVCN